MNTNKDKISDELLAAYLDGELDEQQSKFVEDSVENSPELQWVVDQWIAEQTIDCDSTRVDAERIKTMAESDKKVADKHTNKRVWAIAASILVVIGVSFPLLFRMNDISSYSGLPMDFPASRCDLEYSYNDQTPGIDPSGQDEIEQNDEEEKISYEYEIYKGTLIFLFHQKFDTIFYEMYSKDNQLIKKGNSCKGVCTLVAPLVHITESDKPIIVKLKLVQGLEVVFEDRMTLDF